MAVNYYRNIADKSGFLRLFEAELYSVINSNKQITYKQNIGIIDWWWCTNQERNLESIKEFVDSQNVCFFISEEILNPGHLQYSDIDNIIDLLNKNNVYFILSAQEPELQTIPNSKRTLQFPWFFKTFLDIGNDFEPDLEFKNKPYTFNMLLGSKKVFRTKLYEQLKENNKIYSTYLGHPEYKHNIKNNLDPKSIQNKLLDQDVLEHRLNTMLEVDDYKAEISHIIPTEIYDQTHFDIVSESQADKNIHFTTEKTAKPLATCRFFINTGVNDVKPYLESYGFDLTDYMFESYGESVVDLINEITNNDQLIVDIYSKTKSARVHNMMNYNEHSQNFWSNLNVWLSECLNKSF